MSITIRLSRVGKRNAPAYKIVVMNARDKRYGKFLEVLGHYNPSQKPESYALNEDKFKEWVGKGAGVTKAVEQLREGKYVHKPYAPNKTKEEKQAEATAGKVEEPVIVEVAEEETTEVVENAEEATE